MTPRMSSIYYSDKYKWGNENKETKRYRKRVSNSYERRLSRENAVNFKSVSVLDKLIRDA